MLLVIRQRRESHASSSYLSPRLSVVILYGPEPCGAVARPSVSSRPFGQTMNAVDILSSMSVWGSLTSIVTVWASSSATISFTPPAEEATAERLTQEATYVAPPGAGAYAGQSQGIVVAQVIDYALNIPVTNAIVTLGAGPSPTRNDLTDASGTAVFPSILPTTVALNHYDLAVAAQGYTTLKDDAAPAAAARTSIVAGQTFQTVLRIYKGATIYVSAKNADGSTYTGPATATLSSSRGTQSWTFTGGLLTVTSIAGEPVVPNLQYTARILASNGMYSVASTALAPNNYPADLTKTFVATLNNAPATMVSLTVKVVNAAGVAQAGAAVTLSGGPGSNIALTGTTDASGNAVFSVPSNSSSPGYTTAAKSGALTGTASGAVTATTTRTVTIR